MSGGGTVSVVRCPDGPLLVRGASVVLDEAGNEHPVTRPVVALCVCGKSSRPPWCDGTHKLVRQRPSAPPLPEDLPDRGLLDLGQPGHTACEARCEGDSDGS